MQLEILAHMWCLKRWHHLKVAIHSYYVVNKKKVCVVAVIPIFYVSRKQC